MSNINQTIADLNTLCNAGPPSMGTGLGGGSLTELKNEQRWVERLADGLHAARKEATTPEQIEALITIGKKWDIRIAPAAAAPASYTAANLLEIERLRTTVAIDLDALAKLLNDGDADAIRTCAAQVEEAVVYATKD